MTPRPRDNRHLAGYDYLYRDRRDGMYYMKHPVTAKEIRLKTKDFEEAKALWSSIIETWRDDVSKRVANRIIGRARAAQDVETFAQFVETWRLEILPTLIAKRGGKSISDKTRSDYERMCRRVEKYAEFDKLGVQGLEVSHFRRYLNAWFANPNYYNYMKSLLSRIMQTAIQKGVIEKNPLNDVERLATIKRETYITDAAYSAIREKLQKEWLRRAVDMIYLVSHNPSDVLGLKHESIVDGVIGFTRGKTTVPIEIEANDDLRDTIAWFARWKRKQGLTSPWIICYPITTHRRLVGTRVPASYISRRFAAASVAAGFEAGQYTLRDLRPKGLTDEYLLSGDSDKGGHKTQQMKEHYRRVKLPMRSRSTISRPKFGGKK